MSLSRGILTESGPDPQVILGKNHMGVSDVEAPFLGVPLRGFYSIWGLEGVPEIGTCPFLPCTWSVVSIQDPFCTW